MRLDSLMDDLFMPTCGPNTRGSGEKSKKVVGTEERGLECAAVSHQMKASLSLQRSLPWERESKLSILEMASNLHFKCEQCVVESQEKWDSKLQCYILECWCMHLLPFIKTSSIQGDESCKSNNVENIFTPPKNVKKRISSSSAAVELSDCFAKHLNGLEFIYSLI